jgi:hypothetical protein
LSFSGASARESVSESSKISNRVTTFGWSNLRDGVNLCVGFQDGNSVKASWSKHSILGSASF